MSDDSKQAVCWRIININATPANQSYWAVMQTSYTATGEVATTTDADGFVTYSYYDALDRPVRTVDAVGRETRTEYDADGRILKVIKAWRSGYGPGEADNFDCAVMRADTGSNPLKLQQCYQKYAYTANGQILWVEDAFSAWLIRLVTYPLKPESGAARSNLILRKKPNIISPQIIPSLSRSSPASEQNASTQPGSCLLMTPGKDSVNGKTNTTQKDPSQRSPT